MARITGFTADRMKEIEDTTVVGGFVDVNGRLLLQPRVGEPIDAGSVVGPQGAPGIGTPAGSIVMFATTAAPFGWLMADGSAISRTDYANLFGVIGTTYGAGDGSTTFNLPNFKGRVPVGQDSAQTEFDVLGETGGAKTHKLTTAEMPSHTHTQNAHTHTQDAHTHIQIAHTHGQDAHQHDLPRHDTGADLVNPGTNANRGYITSGGFNPGTLSYPTTAINHNATPVNQNATATNQNATATNQNAGGDGSHNNLQPYLVMNYIIKT